MIHFQKGNAKDQRPYSSVDRIGFTPPLVSVTASINILKNLKPAGYLDKLA